MSAKRVIGCCLGLLILQPGPASADDAGASPSAATPPATPAPERMDLTTRSGITYLDCIITRVEPDGISVTHTKGVAKIPFTDLPEAFQKKYNYDPAKAAAYTRAMNEKLAEAQAIQQAEEKKRLDEEAAVAARQAAQRAAAAPATGVVPVPTGGQVPIPPPQGLIAAEAIQGMAKRMDETEEQFQARKSAAIDEAVRKNREALKGGVDEVAKGGEADDLRVRGLIAAEAIQGMVPRLGETKEQFEARKRAAIDEALRKSGGQ
jgi:hypothetical protein